MCDGVTRRRITSTRRRTWMGYRIQVYDWRRHSRLAELGVLTERTAGVTWSRRLLNVLLEELHIGDDFDALAGPITRVAESEYPRLLVIALLLRHSWCPQDLERTATRLGLSLTFRSSGADTNAGARKPGDRTPSHHGRLRLLLSRSRARYH